MAEGRHLDNWIDGYVKYLENTESPDIFKKWVAISTISAVLKRKCCLEWHTHGDTYPNMYIVLVGPAAIGKGISMGPALDLLNALGIKISAQSVTRQALIEDMLECTETRQVGTEMIQETSITIFSEEFSVFLGHQQVELVSNLTNWFDCPRTWTYKTKARGEEKLHGLYVNIIGATTPGILQKSLTEDALSGGFTSRVVLVYSDKKSKIVPIPAITKNEKDLYNKLLLDLQRISELQGHFRVTDEFIERWVDW